MADEKPTEEATDTAAAEETPEVVREPERLQDGYAWVYHKQLDRTIQVPDSAVPMMRGSGWEYGTDPSAEPEPEPPEDTKDSGPQASGRRRTSKKETS